MRTIDRNIMEAYFRLEESRRERLRLQRIWEPESFVWKKQGEPPKQAWSTEIRKEALATIGKGPETLRYWREQEAKALEDMQHEVEFHVLWPHFERIKGISFYLAGAFIAASGDIERAPTVSSFWKGMGLDLVNGIPPRRVRGAKGSGRNIPCLPHVSLVGEQIRQQMVRSGGKMTEVYQHYRAHYDAKYPDRPKLFNFKAALRATQKLLYSCLWRAWREAYGLPAPEAYAFEILQHTSVPKVISDFYEETARPGG